MITDADVKVLKKTFTTKDDLRTALDNQSEDFDHKLDQKFTEFKSEVFDKLDKVIGELQTHRQERTITDHQIGDHEERISSLESHPAIATS